MPPSPASATTVRSRWTSAAAIAAGRPYPIAPDVGPRNVPGRRNRKPRPTQPAKLPASVVTIASSGSTARSVVTTRPGWMPGPSHGVASTTVAASHAARSAALLASRVATFAASRTPRLVRISFAAFRNVRASEVMTRSAAGSPLLRPGSMSTWIQRVPVAGRVYSYDVASFRREPSTRTASAPARRSRTTAGDPRPAMPR